MNREGAHSSAASLVSMNSQDRQESETMAQRTIGHH